MAQSIKSNRKRSRCKGYDEWTKKIRENYKFTCFLCGDSGHELHAHHILPYYKYIEHRVDPDNGVLMCKSCHMTFHELYGFLNNTLDQLLEYFTKRRAPHSKIEFLKNLLDGKIIINRKKIVRRINTIKIKRMVKIL